MKEQTKKLILFVAICIVTVAIVIIALGIHNNKVKNNLSTSYINNYLTEIKYADIKNHIIEEPNAIIYVSNSSKKNSEVFEKLFAPVIKKYNLENYVIYINVYNQKINDVIYKNTPEIIIYKNSKVYEVIDANTLKSEKDVIKAFKERGIISD